MKVKKLTIQTRERNEEDEKVEDGGKREEDKRVEEKWGKVGDKGLRRRKWERQKL